MGCNGSDHNKYDETSPLSLCENPAHFKRRIQCEQKTAIQQICHQPKTFDLVAKLENTLSDHVIVSFFVENVAILVFVFLVLLRVPNTLKITRFELLVQFNGVSDSRYAFHLGSVWNLETLHAIAVTPSSQKKLRMLEQEYAKIDVLAYS